MTAPDTPDGETHCTRPRRAAGRQLAAFALFCALALLLNAESLRSHAGRLGGWRATVADGALDAAAPAGRSTGAYRLRSTAETLRARLDERGAIPLAEGSRGAPRVLLVGDSMMEDLAGPLSDELERRWGATSGLLAQRGSTLGMESLFDWEGQLGTEVRTRGWDVVVVMLDAHVPVGADRWHHQYREQLDSFADAAFDAGADAVVWLERPVVADTGHEALRAQRDAAHRAAAAGDTRVSYVRAAASVAGPAGQYAAQVTANGRRVQIREPDGVHLTPAGAALFARAVSDQLDALVR